MSSFKAKMSVIAVILVLALTAILYVAIITPWANRVRAEAQADVDRAAEVVQRSQRLHSYDLVALAKQISIDFDFVNAITTEEGHGRRQAIFEAITEYDQKLRAENRKAHFFAVVDRQGKVIARDLNIKDMHGDKLGYRSVSRALAGLASSDVLFMKNRMMRAAAAPIVAGEKGQVQGAVVIAYDFTAAEARAEHDRMNAHVVYVMDGAARASSFFVGGKEDGAQVKAVGAALTAGGSPAATAFGAEKISELFEAVVDNETYMVKAGPLPGSVEVRGVEMKNPRAKKTELEASKNVGFAVMVNMSQRLAAVTKARMMIGGCGLLFVLLILGCMWAVARYFVRAEDNLELGVAEVINGNLDYVFDAQQEFEGLANALNVMLARLLGRPEPGEDDESDQSWRADLLSVEDLDSTLSGGGEAQQLAAEPEAAYYSRIHGEYIAARKAVNLQVDGITLESFTQKVRANEAMLKAKHKCAMVRFMVSTGGGKVSLRPIKIG